MNKIKNTVLPLFVLVIFLVFGQKVSAYNVEGNGVCTCDSCSDCTQALSDNTNCTSTVKLTQDITDFSGTCINNPNSNNKTFDCQNHTIDGDDSQWSYGIHLSGRSGNTIKNCTISDFWDGIYLSSSANNNTITNNTVTSNVQNGIYLENSSGNNLIGNVANSNEQWSGIYLYSSSNNRLENNTANSNGQTGIRLYTSSNNNLINNVTNSNGGFGIYLLFSSNNNVLTNNTATLNRNGITIYSSSNNTLTNNTANSNSNNGITIEYHSSNNYLENNFANSNGADGILINEFSSSTTLIKNTANSNNFSGISISGTSTDNVLVSNITNSNHGNGIQLLNYSTNNILRWNIAKLNNINGLYIDSNSSNNNRIETSRFCSNNQSGGNYYDILDESNNHFANNICDTSNPQGKCAFSCDCARVIINPTSGLATTESGGRANFSVSLNCPTMGEVRIDFSSSDQTEGQVSPTSLTFTTSTWNIPQTVTITGIDDFVDDGNVTYFILTGPTVSADEDYNNLDPENVEVTNIDNDEPVFGGDSIQSQVSNLIRMGKLEYAKELMEKYPHLFPSRAETQKPISCPYFVKHLRFGVFDPEVKKVQQFLKDQGFFPKDQETTNYFGPITLSAVKKFQAKFSKEILQPWGITQPTGYWFITTKKQANKLVGCE